MAKITLGVGAALTLLGVVLFALAEKKSPTAFIPSFFGLPVAILGFVGMRGGESARKHTAHIAVMITLLGTLGGLGMGIPGLLKGKGLSATGQIIMGVICAVHVVLSVKSFIAAKKAREAAAAGSDGDATAAAD